MEIIAAKYLSPKQSATAKTTKHLIKRPYGVSVTDLDVVGENIIKKQKKPMKKKSTGGADDDDQITTPKSKTKKTSSTAKKIPSSFDVSQVLHSTGDSLSTAHHQHLNISHLPSSSIDLTKPSYQVFSYQSDPYVQHPYQQPPLQYQQSEQQPQQQQHTSTSSSSTCGRCYQQINVFHLGGNCTQCGVTICYTCWINENYNVYYCNNCRSLNYIS